MFKKRSLAIATLFLSGNSDALAQIVPDSSLPTNSTVIKDQNLIIINDGSQAGSNLFHSFQEFSIPQRQTAIFNNGLDIQNIFSRVTGSSISQINGILSAKGTANLFFLNPNGIVFGKNGAIAVGGSFFGSTANRVLFTDGFEFNTNTNSPTPLLTISRPRGLGFSNPGQILVKGTGHQLRLATDNFEIGINPVIPILGGGQSTTGLRTAPNQTLGLIGGEIIIDEGILTAFSGHIELASIEEGIVQLNQLNSGFNFNYDNISQFHNILIDNQGLLDASGFAQGKVNVTAKNLSIQDGGTIFISSFGETAADSIKIKATESVNLTGVSDFSQLSVEELNSNTIIKGIYSYVLSSGKGADINISAEDIFLKNISSIVSITFGPGAGGNINLQAQDEININGFNPFSVFLPSAVSAVGVTTGKTGNLAITSQKLLIENGAFMLSQPIGIGEGGLIKITVSDSLIVSGTTPLNPEQTEFTTSSIGSTNLISEKLGDLIIDTGNLILSSGGIIGTNTSSSGNASNIFITADSVEITGRIPNDSVDFTLSSQISSSADRPTAFFREFLNLSEIPSGDSGSINIKTKELSISNQGVINVINEGTGNAGNININAEKIYLDGGNISATTLLGKGGNINLQTQDLSLINNSNISATAGGRGNGGNIKINSDSLLLKGQSQITADAFAGDGGNILINTEVFLVSNDSVITASSELGIDGVVEINTPETNLKSVIVPIKAQILELDPNIAQRCLNKKGEKGLFLMKGKDAIPTSTEDSSELFEEESTPQFIDITENMSEAQKQFYHQHLPPNVMIRTETGDLLAINLCLKDFWAGK